MTAIASPPLPMRLSVTSIEQLRLVRETEWAKESELIDSLRGLKAVGWQAQCGTAFHALLERHNEIYPDDRGQVQVAGFIFDYEDIEEAVASLPKGGVPEVKTTRDAEVEGEPVVIVGKTDRIIGLDLHDFKCKFSSWDMDYYESSLQWRFYLWCFGAQSLTYHLFSFGEPSKRDGVTHLKAIDSFTFHAYSRMEEDVLEWVREFVAWARRRGLDGLLRRVGT